MTIEARNSIVGHTGGTENLADLLPRRKVRREVAASQPAEIDQLAHPCEPARPRRTPVPRPGRPRRTDDSSSSSAPGSRPCRHRRERARSSPAGVRHPGRPRSMLQRSVAGLGATGEAAHPLAALLERVEQATAHVPGGSGQQDQALGRDGVSVDVTTRATDLRAAFANGASRTIDVGSDGGAERATSCPPSNASSSSRRSAGRFPC